MSKSEEWPEHILLGGREWTREELDHIREIIRLFPRLSQTELAYTVCETLEWYAPNGKPKMDACREVLRKLDAKDWIRLPEKRKPTWSGKSQSIRIGTDTEPEEELTGTVSDVAPVRLDAVYSQADMARWNAYVQRYHALGYKRPFGAHQRYFVRSEGQGRLLGCLLFSASAWALGERDRWIGWSKEVRSQRLSFIVNNTRFLLFPWVRVKNLASKVLSLAVRQVPVDWKERYGFEPVLLETFVDTAHYEGTCYRAANWIDLGLTAGRGRMDRTHEQALSPKRIFVYPLRRNFRAQLCGAPDDVGERDE